MDLRSGLRLLRERWKLIVAVTLLALAASAFFTARQTPQYASTATMFVSSRGSAEDTAAAYQGSLLSQQKVKSYAELMRGQRVMSGVADRLELDLTPKQIAGRVSSTTIPDTSLLRVTVHDSSPQRAQQIADAVSKEFARLVPQVETQVEGEPAVKVSTVSPAEEPAVPVSPKPARNLAVAGVLGLLGGFGLAVARRALDTTIKTTEQVEEISGAPSLGTVGYDSTTAKRPLVNPAVHVPRAEAFRKIRTNLQFMDVDRPHQAILVTSAVPGEGKSVTACNVASALAEAGKRVIIIDADLRRPAVAGYLGLPNGVGLTSVLLGKAQLEDAVQGWGGRLFHALTSGPVPPNPTALLTSHRLRTLLEELRAGYDVVIIDSPPTLPVADAPALAAACDGVAVVVRYGKTRQDQLAATMRALQGSGVPVLGTVLNQAPQQRSTYYYYHYDYRGKAGSDRRPPADVVPAPATGASVGAVPAEPVPNR